MRLLIVGGLVVMALALSFKSNTVKNTNLDGLLTAGNGTYTVTGNVEAGMDNGQTVITVDGRSLTVNGIKPSGRGAGEIQLSKEGDTLTLVKFVPTVNAQPVELQPYVRNHNGHIYAVTSNGQLLEVSQRMNAQ